MIGVDEFLHLYVTLGTVLILLQHVAFKEVFQSLAYRSGFKTQCFVNRIESDEVVEMCNHNV